MQRKESFNLLTKSDRAEIRLQQMGQVALLPTTTSFTRDIAISRYRVPKAATLNTALDQSLTELHFVKRRQKPRKHQMAFGLSQTGHHKDEPSRDPKSDPN